MSTLTTLVQDKLIVACLRVEVAWAMAKLGDTTAALNVFTALAQDDSINNYLRGKAAQGIAALGDTITAIKAHVAIVEKAATTVEQAIVEFVAKDYPMGMERGFYNLHHSLDTIMETEKGLPNLNDDDTFDVAHFQIDEQNVALRTAHGLANLHYNLSTITERIRRLADLHGDSTFRRRIYFRIVENVLPRLETAQEALRKLTNTL